MAKITVAEWRNYISSDWDEDLWIDDEEISVAGQILNTDDDTDDDFLKTLLQTAEVKIKWGCIYKNSDPKFCIDLKSDFLRWRKDQTHTKFVVEIVKSDALELIEFIKKHGGKVFL